MQFFSDGELVKTHPFQAKGRRTDWADLPQGRVGFFMRNPNWCRAQAAMWAGPATRWSKNCWRSTPCSASAKPKACCALAKRYGDDRLEAACRRAIEAGDPSYKTVKGILAAGTETAPVQGRSARHRRPGVAARPGAFGEDGR